MAGTGATLDNGFVRVQIASAPPQIAAVYADFDGAGNFSSASVLAAPYALLRHSSGASACFAPRRGVFTPHLP